MFPKLNLQQRFAVPLLLTLLSVTLGFAQRPGGTGDRTEPHKVVYKLKPVAGPLARTTQPGSEKLSQALQRIGAREMRQRFPERRQAYTQARKASPTVDLSLIYELQYADAYTLEQVQRVLLGTGMVAYVEPLYLREPLTQPNDPSADSLKTSQYYLKLVQAYEGWAVEKGDTNVVIGVLDTGFRLTHDELKTKVKHNYSDPVDGVDNDGDGYVDNFTGWDFADNDNNVADDTPFTGHGTAVAGVAAGATNNGKGIASLGYNAFFMPLKVFSAVENGHFGGYEAIVYAADKGCKVINISWGGTGKSEYEQDIINYAVLDKDVLIVAAGGNTNKLLDVYPASYENVLSVGGTTDKDVKYRDFTYSYRIDMVAPGTNILTSTISSDNAYGGVYGTSFSSPIVAGSAALVRSKYPQLSALQAAERLRVTTDNIYNLPGNAQYTELLGSGRLNLKRALKATNLKSVRCTAHGLAQRTQTPFAGSKVSFETSYRNHLSPTSALEVTLTCSSPFVTVERGTLDLGSLATNATASSGSRPFILNIAEDAPMNELVYLRLGYQDGSYTDFEYVSLVINPSYVTLTANSLHVTLNNVGNLGYNGLNFTQGVGVKYKGSPSLLFEGGLMVATDAGMVSENLHNEQWQNNAGFQSASSLRLRHDTPLATQEARTLMAATGPSQAGVQVKQVSSAWMDAPNQDYVILEYQVTNVTEETIGQVHVGVFADWDIGNYLQNAASWDNALKLGYVYNTQVPMPYAGLKLLTNGAPIHHAIDNIGGNDSTVTVDDGFSTAEKFKVISRGMSRKSAGGKQGNSVSHVVGATLNGLVPGETRTVALALLAADNLSQLKTHAAAAQAKYITIKSGPKPSGTRLALCAGSPVLITPDKGSSFRFYADQEKAALLGAGSSFAISALQASRTVYATNADSLFESQPVPYAYSIPAEAEADFTLGQGFGNAGSAVPLTNTSRQASSFHWAFGDGTTSSEANPTHTYPLSGVYTITLTATDSLGCAQSMTSKQLQVYADKLTLYPNPVSGSLVLNLPGPVQQGNSATVPVLTLTDIMGKVMTPPYYTEGTMLHYDVSRLAAGVYIARIRYSESSLTERVLVQNR
ncbi:S8 family serine peptidase [Pontibacter sp. E15-1]|uniref:S8 family serine peptidase n=1 Tax=Pontibacter sp. E15-1 TaxID=2919918 RepID=UPI001F4FC85F|nr:S8 family serine peptidase [Pontibacter sp. E15-1]MCJ8166590.1 S8 family serine peptidase [Pontibacter sp. E15-1]